METTAANVDITFLRMDHPPTDPAPAMPSDYTTLYVPNPEVDFYRYLHQAVGAPYMWWMRRHESNENLLKVLRHPMIGIFVLYHNAQPAGFYELDGRPQPNINLSYFGLMPHAVGMGLGHAFLRQAVDRAWSLKPKIVLVNTNNGDHPRAMPNYLRVGFRPYHKIAETWHVPNYLGITVPDHMLADPDAPSDHETEYDADQD